MSSHLIPSSEEHTPLMKQYWELKAQVPDALLFFRMGDFYELFGEDAITAATLLEITLTSRDRNKPNPIPMAGVPHHSAQGYIQRLLKAGKKIAIGEQMEAPDAPGPGKIVRREIVRILTPAVQFDSESTEAAYLAILAKSGSRWILACLDPSTGESLVSDPMEIENALNELKRLPVRHYLHLFPELETLNLPLSETTLRETLPKNYLTLERAQGLLKKHFQLENLSAFISTDAGTFALGILLTYVLRTQQKESLAHLRLPEPLRKPQSMTLGPNTAEHLDLPDLFALINQTRSALGARQLRRWMMAPLKDPDAITDRQKAVQELTLQSSTYREKIFSQLSQIYDLERICGRINTRLANPRDTLALGQSLLNLRTLDPFILSCTTALWKKIRGDLHQLSETLSPLAEKIIQIQKEEAPLIAREGGIFKAETDTHLNRLISLSENGQRWLIELEAREREATGIASLKVRYNRVFGYYIEITQAHLKNVPAHYQRKQTMVGAERFFTEELKKFEEEILTASVQQKSYEQELFNKLIDEIQSHTTSIMTAARLLGEIDALSALTQLAGQPGWVFPKLDCSLDLNIELGRHPMVDQAKPGHFVPNHLELSAQTRLTLMITGPNMGGKSTVMRQTALIVILGQMGAPVPAHRAHWGVVSSVYTRIGAQDAIARGQSTFMVEMSELAHILHQADSHSLIILDEIGRGTSTYDGISVAWATLEWICQQVKARTLFATHYHELVQLASSLPLLANAHMAVESTQKPNRNTLRFLYELREGPTNESFGIHVAQLAGLPKPVIQRAWTVLADLEKSTGNLPAYTNQLSLFSLRSETESIPSAPIGPEPPHPVLRELEELDINEMTPIQALNFVVKLQELRKNAETPP